MPLRSRLLLILTALLSGPAAFAGGGNDGGNCVLDSTNPGAPCESVEHFFVNTKDLNKLPGYDLFEKRLGVIRKELPDLADALQFSLEAKSVYLIPQQFDVLNADVTGLIFSTKQPAYQNDEEIFFSKIGTAGMSEKGVFENLMHEAAEAMQTKRNVSRVRTLTDALIADPFDPIVAQNAAERAKFGPFLTRSDRATLKADGRKSYLNEISQILSNVRDACRANAPLSTVEKLFDHAPKNLPNAKVSDPYEKNGTWISPFSVSHFYGLSMLMPIGFDRDAAINKFLGDTCVMHTTDVNPCLGILSMREVSEKAGRDGTESDTAMLAYDRLRVSVSRDLEASARDVLAELEKSPAFIRILAVHQDGIYVDDGMMENYRKDSDQRITANILDDVAGKRRMLNVGSPKVKRRMLCDDAADVEAVISPMLLPASTASPPAASADDTPASSAPNQDSGALQAR